MWFASDAGGGAPAVRGSLHPELGVHVPRASPLGSEFPSNVFFPLCRHNQAETGLVLLNYFIFT